MIVNKIYIDCGAWTGDSVLKFQEHYNDYDVYAFECHPSHKDELIKLSEQHNFTFIDKAVWIYNGALPFYVGTKDRTAASTLRKSKKKKIDKNNPIYITCIDFPDWLMTNFDKEQYIVCKMNIEGAEYNVLERMIKNKSIRYINELFVSWHHSKIGNVGKKKHDQLLKNLEGKTKILKWSFVEGQKENPFKGIL